MKDFVSESHKRIACKSPGARISTTRVQSVILVLGITNEHAVHVRTASGKQSMGQVVAQHAQNPQGVGQKGTSRNVRTTSSASGIPTIANAGWTPATEKAKTCAMAYQCVSGSKRKITGPAWT